MGEASTKCCYDKDLTADQCATAADCDNESDYCSSTAENCADCSGVFCSDEPAPPAPTPAPTPVPTPPSGESKCCYDKDLTADQCSTAADCDGSSDYCSSSSDNCKDCSGVFCAGDAAVIVAELEVSSKCCYDKDLTADQCATAADCDGESDYCSSTAENCADCSG